MITRPMLAGTCKDISKIIYPVLVSPKLDGIRAIVQGQGRVMSRTLKDIPNRFIRETLQELTADLANVELDGELIVGSNFQTCTSGIMSGDGEPDFCYHVFDVVHQLTVVPFKDRLDLANQLVNRLGTSRIVMVPHRVVKTEEELLAAEAEYLAEGYEGLMVRDPAGPYKHGRSTEKQGWLLKVKRFVDSEAEILGFEEMMHNANDATKDELGHTKRSSHKANKLPMGTLGRFLVRDVYSGVEFAVGTGVGLTQALRQEIWDDRDQYLGRIVKYKSQPHGVKDAPRLPIWLGFRDSSDM